MILTRKNVDIGYLRADNILKTDKKKASSQGLREVLKADLTMTLNNYLDVEGDNIDLFIDINDNNDVYVQFIAQGSRLKDFFSNR